MTTTNEGPRRRAHEHEDAAWFWTLTILTVAVSSIERRPDFSKSDLRWVINA